MLASHSMSLALGGSKMAVGGGGGARGKQNKKVLLPAERIYWMLERCGGVKIMQMRRSVKQSWTRLTEGILGPRSHLESTPGDDLSAKMLQKPQPCSSM